MRSTTEGEDRILRVICLALIATGVALRFHRLSQPLWLDEAVNANLAALDFRDIPAALAASAEITPPLFLFVAHAWTLVFGGTDAALHLLTACIGVLGVLATWRLAERVAGPGTGPVCAALLALHPLHLAHSQEFRAYGLLLLLSALSTELLFRALDEDRTRDWIAFATATLANLYTHDYAVFLLLAQGAGSALSCRGLPKPRRAHLALAGSLLGVGAAPWALQAWVDLHKPARSHMTVIGLRDAVATLDALAGLKVSVGAASGGWPAGIRVALAVAYLGLATYLVRRAWSARPREFSLLACLILVTLLVPFSISIWEPIYLGYRYSIIVLPFVCVLWGLALRPLASVRSRLAVLFFLATLSAYTVAVYFSSPKSFDREIARYLLAHDRPGVGLVIYPAFLKIPIARYYPAAGRALPRLSADGDWPAMLMTLTLLQDRTPIGTDALADRYRQTDEAYFGAHVVARTFVRRR